MRVGIMAYLLHAGSDYRSAGVSRYIQSLVEHLPAVAPQTHFLVFHGADAPKLQGVERVTCPLSTANPAVRIACEQAAVPLMCDRLDVLHGTVNVLPAWKRRPSVVTVHDLAFLRHADRFPLAKVAYLTAALGATLRQADRVIAVSQNTRLDLIQLAGAAPETIDVVYNGVDAAFRPLDSASRERFRKEQFGGRPYILHVGTLEPRKNIDVLIRAFASLRQTMDIPHVLALVGARGWSYRPLFEMTAALGLEDEVHFVDYVSPAALPLWYNGADLFAYPSAYEGFGLPVLEAMACGVPTVTSASSSLSELAGEACLTVSPGNQEELEAAMAHALTDQQLRARLIQAGLQRAACFSWENTARGTVEVYRRAEASR